MLVFQLRAAALDLLRAARALHLPLDAARAADLRDQPDDQDEEQHHRDDHEQIERGPALDCDVGGDDGDAAVRNGVADGRCGGNLRNGRRNRIRRYQVQNDFVHSLVLKVELADDLALLDRRGERIIRIGHGRVLGEVRGDVARLRAGAEEVLDLRIVRVGEIERQRRVVRVLRAGNLRRKGVGGIDLREGQRGIGGKDVIRQVPGVDPLALGRRSEDDRGHLQAVLFAQGDERALRGVGKAGLSADHVLVGELVLRAGQHAVAVVEGIVADRAVGLCGMDGILRRLDDLQEGFVLNGLQEDLVVVLRRGVVVGVRQAVRRGEVGVCAAQFLGPGVHHVRKGVHGPGDRLGQGHARVVAALEQQAVHEVAHRDALALLQIDGALADHDVLETVTTWSRSRFSRARMAVMIFVVEAG